MSAIPPPRRDCEIEALGHQPNVVQVLRLAAPQKATAPRVVALEISDHTDALGRVGLYRLTLADGSVRTVFDHDPDRARALRAALPDADVRLTDAGILYIGDYCLSVAPVDSLSERRPCGANPWLEWLADGEDDEIPAGGFLIRPEDLEAALGD